ncbi:MAG: MATE family efflux transporter [Gemmatimonadota bacterium]|nr:MATE family efflux transporter [Gemmatimonadota bacterium]
MSPFRALLRLALPIVTVQVGMMFMGVVDTIMVGHLSARGLAAVALGNLYFWGSSIFGTGVIMALDPVIAQAVGARDEIAVTRGFQRGLLLAALLVIPTSIVMLFATPALRALGQQDDIVPLAAQYVLYCVPGVFPFLAFNVLRQTLQAMQRVRPIVITIVIANVANVLLNWMLIFGRLGAPALGVTGAAWATSASRWVMIVVLVAVSWRQLHHHLRPVRADTFAVAPLGRMLALGAPIGFQFQLEYGIFAVVGLLMGTLGTPQLAGHQVALNIASFTFMVPMGIAAAVAVLVGHAVGRDDPIDARRAAVAALVSGVGFMIGAALLLLAMPGLIARIYTTDVAVTAVALVLIPLAGFFQVFDGMQVVCGGILRGLGDTHSPLIANIVGFWVIGLPLGLWLGMRQGQGPAGLWWGLVVGLAVVGVGLLVRVRVRMQRTMRRVQIDYVRSEI